jgi:hypothetical protein
MPVVSKNTYYYDATIIREGGQSKRQGTVIGSTDKEAMDTVFRMAQAHWNRPLIQVDLYKVVEGGELNHVMTSTVGETHARSLVSVPFNPAANDPSPPKVDTFAPWTIGSQVHQPNFAVLKFDDTKRST